MDSRRVRGCRVRGESGRVLKRGEEGEKEKRKGVEVVEYWWMLPTIRFRILVENYD